MLFNSLVFLIFGAIFFAIWPLVRNRNGSRWVFIVIMSFIFYGWWDWRFLFLIVGNGLINFYTSLGIEKFRFRKKSILILALFGNIGSLFIFKYSGFIAHLIEDFLELFSINIDLYNHLPEFTLILPVGISFFTFQAMSYTIDVYYGKIKPTKNILHFFSYLAMFPQLVAGPIVRARDLLVQLTKIPRTSDIQLWHGIKLFVFGLFQKTVLADNIALMVDTAFQNKSPYEGSIFWWVVIIGFAFQIYCDFSGYSLMARGIAKMMGYHFKMNFNHPYISSSLRDFWRRWHISLSTWFRDYVYIPLGGSRKGFWNGMLFMLITMVVSGLWHGAALTFVIWGFIHGVFLGLERWTGWDKRIKKIPLGNFLAFVLVSLQVLLAWVFFRASDFNQAMDVLGKMFASEVDLKFTERFTNPLFYLILALAIEIFIFIRISYPKIKHYMVRNNFDVIAVVLSLLACIFLRGPQAEFIYFQF